MSRGKAGSFAQEHGKGQAVGFGGGVVLAAAGLSEDFLKLGCGFCFFWKRTAAFWSRTVGIYFMAMGSRAEQSGGSGNLKRGRSGGRGGEAAS